MLAEESEKARTELSLLDQRVAVIDAERRRQLREADLAEAAVSEVLGEDEPTEMAALARAAEAACRSLLSAVRSLGSVVEAHEAAGSEAEAAVTSSFSSSEEVLRSAAMTEAEISALERRSTEWEHRLGALRATLSSLQELELPDEAPEVETFREVAEAARAAATAARDEALVLRRDLDHVRGLLDAADDLERHHSGDRERLAALDEVTGVLSGRRTAHKVALESWVLSAYLREVVDAANQRLRAMTRGRYELVVDSSHVRGTMRSGLDLAVLDAHTGKSRPTQSLSGGETFQASLSLALGLADVLTADSGGVRIDALFVDEGFGSLDGDALQTAVDVLDGLRDRGTMVGVVTHLEHLKEALPVAIEVTPRADRRGSELHQSVLV